MGKALIYTKKPEVLNIWDFPDTKYISVDFLGLETTEVAELTQDNLQFLIESHNVLVEAFSALCKGLSVEFDEQSS